MQLLALSREDFLTALTGEAEPGEPLTMDLVLAGGAGHLTVRQKAEILARVPLFSHLDSKELELLAGHCVTDCWPAGSSIIQEGDDGDRFFLLLSGRAAVSIGGRQVNELHPGEQFGEIALLHSVPRTASVTASVEVVTLSLRRDDFVSAVRSRVLLG
jgi:CRP-like cAMP-binding protein